MCWARIIVPLASSSRISSNEKGKPVTLDQLLVLSKIAETGSFRAAAGVLHRAQSAVSYAIKNLEDELGVELLCRDQYRPTLTPAGEAVLLPLLQRGHQEEAPDETPGAAADDAAAVAAHVVRDREARLAHVDSR